MYIDNVYFQENTNNAEVLNFIFFVLMFDEHLALHLQVKLSVFGLVFSSTCLPECGI